MSGLKVELVCNEMVILNEIADKHFTRKHIAQSYALALRSQEAKDGLIDWKKINEAIIARWSMAAVSWIKEQAWSGKCFEEKKAGKRVTEITQEQREWFAGVKAAAAARIVEFKKQPGVTTCELCQAVQFPDIYCDVCKTKKMCLGNDKMCCVCCEEDVVSIDWDKIPLLEDGKE